jgi:hypothetical protein
MWVAGGTSVVVTRWGPAGRWAPRSRGPRAGARAGGVIGMARRSRSSRSPHARRPLSSWSWCMVVSGGCASPATRVSSKRSPTARRGRRACAHGRRRARRDGDRPPSATRPTGQPTHRGRCLKLWAVTPLRAGASRMYDPCWPRGWRHPGAPPGGDRRACGGNAHAKRPAVAAEAQAGASIGSSASPV